MPDISMCSRTDCPKAKYCYRSPEGGAEPNEHWQSWAYFGGDDPENCEDFLVNRRERL